MADIIKDLSKKRHTYDECFEEIEYYMKGIQNGYTNLSERENADTISYHQQDGALRACTEIHKIMMKHIKILKMQEALLDG